MVTSGFCLVVYVSNVPHFVGKGVYVHILGGMTYCCVLIL